MLTIQTSDTHHVLEDIVLIIYIVTPDGQTVQLQLLNDIKKELSPA